MLCTVEHNQQIKDSQKTIQYSIIIPHFDDYERLDRLINSIPGARADIQIIVVDDCSPQQVRLCTLKEKHPQVLWLTTPLNKGAGAARNIGIQQATGRWLLFADSDDMFTPGAFDIIDDNLDCSCEIIYFLADAYNEIKNMASARAKLYNKLVLEHIADAAVNTSENLRQNHVVPWGKIFNAQTVAEHGFLFDEVAVGNDMAFSVLTAVSAQKIKAVAETIYVVSKRPNSLIGRKEANVFLARVKVAASVSDRIEMIGYKSLRSGNWLLLRSVAYGLGVSIKTYIIISNSSLALKIYKILNPLIWIRFLKKQLQD